MFRRKYLEPEVRTSPVSNMEPALLEICIAMGNARQPLTAAEGLALANSLIEGTVTQRNLIQFQLKRKMRIDGNFGKKILAALYEMTYRLTYY